MNVVDTLEWVDWFFPYRLSRNNFLSSTSVLLPFKRLNVFESSIGDCVFPEETDK